MPDDVRASLEDLAIRWETPRGRELKAEILRDVKERGGNRLPAILEGFMYVSEVVSGCDLRCITWDGEDLEAAAFGKVDLSWASLEGCNMERIDLRGSTLKRANLSQANLVNAHFEGTDCSRTDFSQSNLEGAHFPEAKLTGAVFLGTNLSRASLSEARAMKCNFLGAELSGSNFSEAQVKNANFSTGALDTVAIPPTDISSVFYDLDQEDFEREVGLRAITSRTTKKFKGLDAVLKAQETLENMSKENELGASPGGTRPSPYFGAAPIGSRKFRPGDEERERADFVPRVRPGQPKDAGRRRPPPPPVPVRRARPGGRPGSRHLRRPPTRRVARPARPPHPAPSGAHRITPTAPPASAAFNSPIAPFDPAAPDPTGNLAKAVGLILQLQPRLTKIVLELGDKSCVVYRQE